ncbi:hypothetical protein OAL27_00330 [Verrucomicrobiales bacterium]|nr:hypothetical protein [Verrucomicrobiales bacterium]
MLEFISWPRYCDSTRFHQAFAISAYPLMHLVGRTRCMGLNAVYLPDHGWYRVDPRGNKDGVDAQFDPPQEKLAWAIRNDGEIDGGWLESKVSFERALSSLLDPITLQKFFTRLSKAMKAAE